MNPDIYALLPPDKQKDYINQPEIKLPVIDQLDYEFVKKFKDANWDLFNSMLAGGHINELRERILREQHKYYKNVSVTNKTIPGSVESWSDRNYDPVQDLHKLKECGEKDRQLSIKDIEELSERMEQQTREGAIKREVDLGNGIKRIIWYKGCRIVDSELSISKERYDELTAWLDEK